MNNTLGNTVGDRINHFDNLEHQTVEEFNNLFPECPLDYSNDSTVEVGSVADNNCRMVTVTNKHNVTNTFKHKMYSDILYTLDRQDYYLDEREIALDEINGVPV